MISESSELSEQKQRLLDQLLRGNGAVPRAAEDVVQARRFDEVPPLSPEQHDIWLHAALASDAPLYNEAVTIHRTGSFDRQVLERALNEILRRHEIWRTTFEERDDGSVYSRVHRELRLELPLIDLCHLAEAEREQAALAIATAEARRPFDLGAAPLLRCIVVRLAPDVHRLYLTLHHLIFDGVSLYRVVMPELAALYAAFERDEPSPLPEPQLQFGDYALWRERQLDTPAAERALAYWRSQLAGDLPALGLPTDRPSPAMHSYRGSMETFELAPDLTADLKAIGSHEGCTLYATLLAAFKALLHRYSGQEDIVIGGVTDTRSRPELQSMIGYFLNGVALRSHPLAQMAFRDYLAQVQLTVVEALDASSVPLNRVVRELRPRRNLGRNPLFQVLFSIQPPAEAFADGWALTQMDVTVGTAKFDLYLELEEMGDRIIGRFIYSTDLFDASTIRRVIGHWISLLEGVASDPGCRLTDLPLLTPSERQELLIERNATRQPYPDITLHRWFEVQAQQTPRAIAIEGNGLSWCYEDLVRRVAVLAERLRQAGVGRETLVGVALERSPSLVAGVLAILRAGGAYLPLDPNLPKARLDLLVSDARPPVILTEASVMERLPPSDACLVIYDDRGVPPSDETPTVDVGPQNLAYVLYTSGSTGKPKAVEIEHRSVVNLLAAVQRDLRLGVDDNLLAVTTLSFDIAALELFLPLVTGARLTIGTGDERADPSWLIEALDRHRCTVMQATPATWRGLLARGWPGHRDLTILCGGEALSRDLAAALCERSRAVWNMYGPTETTIWSLRHAVFPADGPVPIGTPLANTRIYVLDSNGAPVPVGVPGELFIAGDGLARGYRNDADLTAGKFVTVPGLPESRLYRTGDIVKHRSDGGVQFIGRNDNQMKVRGIRIEPAEIEGALCTHSGISQAIVVAREIGPGNCRLVAYVVYRRGQEPTVSEMRLHLRQMLPDYMIPSMFVTLTELPMTITGKTNVRLLPDPFKNAQRRVESFTPPSPGAEQLIAKVWKEMLGIDRIGARDNFFELGGDSLLSLIAAIEIEKQTGWRLPLRVHFFQTLREIAAAFPREEKGNLQNQ